MPTALRQLLLPNGQRLPLSEVLEPTESILEFALKTELDLGTLCWIDSAGGGSLIEARIESKATEREGSGYRYLAKRATPGGGKPGTSGRRRFRLWSRG